MRKAVLFDVHGNLPALEAVLADAQAAGAERFVLGGDYAAFGAFPVEAVARLRELDAPEIIRGNTERWVAAPQEAPDDLLPVLEHCREALGDALAQELALLPHSLPLDGARLCHASPRSDMETFLPAPSKSDEELLAGSDEDVVVFGHSHLQFTRSSGRRLLVNPGSVGMPFDGDRRAAYALWEGGREFELRRVEYDSRGYARELRTRLEPAVGEAVDVIVERIEHAAFILQPKKRSG